MPSSEPCPIATRRCPLSAPATSTFRIVGRKEEVVSLGDDAESQARRVAAAAQREITTFQVPSWLRTIGVGSWLTIGVVALAAVVLCVLALVTEVAIPLAI